jgi:hypothetical protein
VYPAAGSGRPGRFPPAVAAASDRAGPARQPPQQPELPDVVRLVELQEKQALLDFPWSAAPELTT